MPTSEFIEDFKIEALDSLAEVEALLLEFDRLKPTEQSDAVNALFRAFHSIKGVAGFLGFTKIVELTHAFEAFLQQIREAKQMLNCVHITHLLAAQEMLLSMVQNLDKETTYRIDHMTELAEILTKGLDENNSQILEAIVNDEIIDIPIPVQLQNVSNAKTGDSETIRVRTDLLNQLFQLVGELVLIRNQNLLSVNQLDVKAKDQSQRLNIVTSELQSCIMRTRLQPLTGLFNRLNRVARELSGQLNKEIQIHLEGSEVEIDKCLLESLTDPLIHMIRNSCDHGIELSADRIQKNKNPIGQIRISAKYESGEVIIQIQDDGKGMDADWIAEKAVDKKLKTQDEVNLLTKNQKLELIFLPGFSTATIVSDISGRGVGMDVVKTSIEKCGGRIEISSQKDFGSIFLIHLPLTLAIMPAILISTMDERFAISQSNIEELITLHNEEILKRMEIADGQLWLRSRDRLLPVIQLNQLLKSNGSVDNYFKISEIMWNEFNDFKQKISENIPFSKSLIILKIGSQRLALEFDAILGSEEIVVKSLHSLMSNIQIYTGSTVLGDGSIALILDPEGILKFTLPKFNNSKNDINQDMEINVSANYVQCLKFILKNGEKIAIPTADISRIIQLNESQCFELAGFPCVELDGITHQIIDLGDYIPVSKNSGFDGSYMVLPQKHVKPFGIYASKIESIENMDFLPQSDLIDSEIIEMTCLDKGKPILIVNVAELEKSSLTKRGV